MTNNILAATVLSLTILASGASYAGDQHAAAASESLAAQLEQAKAASLNGNTATLGREERQLAGNYLTMAESLLAQGATAKAQTFLSFARGTLGLATPAPTDNGQRITMMNENRV